MKWKQASRQATKLTQIINEIKSGLFGKIHKINKPLGKPTGRELRSKWIKLELKREPLQQIPMKLRNSLGLILKTNIPLN